MRKSILILTAFILLMHSCKKEDTIATSGIVTLDNTLAFNPGTQAYYAYGFLFSQAEKVSTLSTPAPDITVDSDGTNIFLGTNSFKNSFYLSSEYSDEAPAKTAFDNLQSVSVTQWFGLASPLKPHQIWIYRSGTEHYAKIRIISTVSEVRDYLDYAECTFEWVYQPDGSLTVPGK
jgi:hypothetical protein